MITSAIVALWLVQAPIGPPSGLPPMSAPVKEWSLGGAFTLKQEQFLMWQPVFHPAHFHRGWQAELRPRWIVELSPTHRKLANFSLAIESTPAIGSGVGIVRPKLQYRVPGTQLRLGIGVTLAAAYSSGSTGGWRGQRSLSFLSGRM